MRRKLSTKLTISCSLTLVTVEAEARNMQGTDVTLDASGANSIEIPVTGLLVEETRSTVA